MSHSRLFLVTAILSFQAFGGVSIEEKRNRVEYLEELTSNAISMNIDAYKRELRYEELNLPLDVRAMNEANLLAEQIRIQVKNAYEEAVQLKGSNEAIAEVRSAIEKDLELIAPELRGEIQKIALDSLENVNSGTSNRNDQFNKIEKVLLEEVKMRSDFLNKEAENDQHVLMLDKSNFQNANKIEYKNKAEVIASLTSAGPNVELGSSANLVMKSGDMTKTESKISMRVKVEFLGIGIDAGPSINFKREFKTNVSIIAEGLNPVLGPNGAFEYFKKDSNNKPLIKNGKAQKRVISFSCDTSLNFETDYTGSGGFSVAGIGGSTSVTKKYINLVQINSRRILVPDAIGDKIVNLKDLSNLCHLDFLRAKVTNNMTVSDSLNIMMRNVVSGLRFSHPKTKCAQDSHCYNWFNNEIIALVRSKNYPRCVEERVEKYRTCELRGLEGQNCAVYDAKGKRVSDGSFEFICDTGLKCVKTRNAGWFQGFEIYQYAKGACKPIDAKTYRSPHDQTKYYELNLAN